MSTRFIDGEPAAGPVPEAAVQPDAASIKEAVEIEVTAEGNYRVAAADLVNNSPTRSPRHLHAPLTATARSP